MVSTRLPISSSCFHNMKEKEARGETVGTHLLSTCKLCHHSLRISSRSPLACPPSRQAGQLSTCSGLSCILRSP